MNKQISDQGWQQLQAHIEGFLGQAFRDDVRGIEYKPLFIAQSLAMPSERRQNEFQDRMAICDNFSRKGDEHE